MSLPSLFLHHHTLGTKKRPHLISNRALVHYLSFILIFFITTNITRTTSPDVLGYATHIQIDSLISETNNARLESGADIVILNDVLSTAARAKAVDMFEYNYWAHTSPSGTEPWDFIIGEGYDYIFAGENLARDFATSKGVVKAWLESPSHRDNLLNPRYTEMGLAIVDGELNGYPTTLVVQMFGTPRSSIASIGEAKNIVAESTSGVVKSQNIEVLEATLAVINEKVDMSSNAIVPVIDLGVATKNLSLYFIILFIFLFIVDELYVFIKGHNRHVGHSEIHILFMLFLLIVTIYVRSGGIL